MPTTHNMLLDEWGVVTFHLHACSSPARGLHMLVSLWVQPHLILAFQSWYLRLFTVSGVGRLIRVPKLLIQKPTIAFYWLSDSILGVWLVLSTHRKKLLIEKTMFMCVLKREGSFEETSREVSVFARCLWVNVVWRW